MKDTKPEPPMDGPPLAQRQDIVDVIHGTKVADPYRWLEDPKTPETQRWMKDLDAHARGKLGELKERDALSKRLTELSYIDWVSPPIRRGERTFFERRHKDKEKSIWYWRQGKDGEAKVLLDPNTMSADGSTALKSVTPSYDGKLTTYRLSENNADEATLYVMEVETGKVLEKDTIVGAKYAAPSWDPEGKSFYYARLPMDPSIPDKERPGHSEIYHHRIGEDPKDDVLVHGKTGDPTIFLYADLSRDGNYLFLYKYNGWRSNEVYFKDLRIHQKWQPLAVDHDAKFDCYAWKDQIYVRTDHQAPKGKMMRVDPKKPALDVWQELIAERQDGVLRGFTITGDHLSLDYLRKAASQLQIATLQGEIVRDIELPTVGTAYGLYGNPDDDVAYFRFESYTQPDTVYETSVKRGGRGVYFELDVPVDPAPYEVEQVFYKSKDGTEVSMFIIRNKAMKKDGSAPFLLTGYGGFSISETPEFVATSFVWLERGGGLAIPNLRGGGEYGEEWHRAGMLTRKQNVFDDFIAAAEFLIEHKYTQPSKLAIRGASNGGLLVGAAMTQRPDLFQAVSCVVPLLDMIRYHLTESGSTWVSEYGSADDPEQFKAILAYSPYHQVKEGAAYPALLMLSADSDDRVDPMHARKFVAALRHAVKGKSPVLLRVESKAGHGGGDMVKKRVERSTDEYAFLLDQLGMSGK